MFYIYMHYGTVLLTDTTGGVSIRGAVGYSLLVLVATSPPFNVAFFAILFVMLISASMSFT
jgi:hypothetical protein